jgi:hypothetical protein
MAANSLPRPPDPASQRAVCRRTPRSTSGSRVRPRLGGRLRGARCARCARGLCVGRFGVGHGGRVRSAPRNFALLEDEVWSERLEPTSLRHTEPTSFRCAGVSRSALSLLHLTAGASQPVQRPRVSCWSMRPASWCFVVSPSGALGGTELLHATLAKCAAPCRMGRLAMHD